MKTFLIALAVFCCAWNGAASAASPAEKSFPDSARPTKMPWKYQGIWCDANNDNHRPKGFDSNRPWKYTCEESEQQIDFMDDHWNSDTNDVCHYTSFKRTKAFLEVGLQCPNFPVFKARFYPNKIVVLPIKKPVEFCFSAIREDGHVVRGKCVKSQDQHHGHSRCRHPSHGVLHRNFHHYLISQIQDGGQVP